MKRTIIVFLMIAFLAMSLSANAFAVESEAIDSQLITYADGSTLEITVFQIPSITRSSGNITGGRSYTHRDSNGSTNWTATLTASFTYNGASATCTTASCSVSISDSSWYVVSRTASRSGNTATANLTMGRRALGVTVSTSNYTITLSCDKSGNLS